MVPVMACASATKRESKARVRVKVIDYDALRESPET